MDMKEMESAMMEGQARFEKWKNAFESRMIMPYALDTVREIMNGLNDEQKKELRERNTKAYDQVMRLIGG